MKLNPFSRIALKSALAIALLAPSIPAHAMIFSSGNPAVLIVGMTIALGGALVFDSNVAVMVGGLLGDANNGSQGIDLASALADEVSSGRMAEATADAIRTEILNATSNGPLALSSSDAEQSKRELLAAGFTEPTANFIAGVLKASGK